MTTEERFVHLEKQLRSTRALLGALFVSLLGVGLIAATGRDSSEVTFKTVTAEQFIVLGSEDELGRFGKVGEGGRYGETAVLEAQKVTAGTIEARGSVRVLDLAKKPRITLSVRHVNPYAFGSETVATPLLEMTHEDGQPSLRLGALGDEWGFQASISSLSNDAAGIELLDQPTGPKLVLSAGESPDPNAELQMSITRFPVANKRGFRAKPKFEIRENGKVVREFP